MIGQPKRIGCVLAAAVVVVAWCSMPTLAYGQSCSGYRDSFAEARIVGGSPAKVAHWPGFAALRFKDPARSRYYYFCGGTAIAANWVITAAHCVERVKKGTGGFHVYRKPNNRRDGWRVELVLGKDDLEAVGDKEARHIAEIKIRKGYVAPVDGNDIALIRLKTPWKGGVAQINLSGQEPSDRLAFAAGFGALTAGQEPDWKTARSGDIIAVTTPTLQEVSLPLVATDKCQAAYRSIPKWKHAKIGQEQICAGYDDRNKRKDTCTGDSGGPIVVYDKRNCPTQIGIVSWGESCAQPKAYGVYARISSHRDWILEHVPELGVAATPETHAYSAQIADQLLAAAFAQLRTGLGSARDRVRVGVAGGNSVKLGSGLFAFEVASDVAGRLVLLDVNGAGEVVQLFPNTFLAKDQAKLVEAGRPVNIPDASNPAYGRLKGFRPTRHGRGKLIAIVVPSNVLIEDSISPGRHLKPFTVEPTPASFLMNLVHRLLAAIEAKGGDVAGWAFGETNYDIIE